MAFEGALSAPPSSLTACTRASDFEQLTRQRQEPKFCLRLKLTCSYCSSGQKSKERKPRPGSTYIPPNYPDLLAMTAL